MQLENFHDLGSKVIEWRYMREGTQDEQKKVRFISLIYRLSFSGADENKDNEALIVVRLDKEKTCVVGVVEKMKDMNAFAREIADDPKSVCMNEDDLMQTPSQMEFEKKPDQNSG